MSRINSQVSIIFLIVQKTPLSWGMKLLWTCPKSRDLNLDEASYFQSIIGVMSWMVEIGRIYIETEVSLLSSYLFFPWEGHLEAALHVIAYLKQKHNSQLVFDPTYTKINEIIFKDCDWKDFYGDAKEAIPPNAPNPSGKDVDLRAKVDSYHAGDWETR